MVLRERVRAVGVVSSRMASVWAMKLLRDPGVPVLDCDGATAFCNRGSGSRFRVRPISDGEVARCWYASWRDRRDEPADLDWFACRPA